MINPILKNLEYNGCKIIGDNETRKFYKGNISIVFGCGGERDKKNRPLMAKVAKTFCYKIYVTDDSGKVVKRYPAIRSLVSRVLTKVVSSYFLAIFTSWLYHVKVL